MRGTILVFALTLLGGCATAPPVYNTDIRYSHIPMSLDAVVLPRPLYLPNFTDIKNKGTHWELSHKDWQALVEWQIEADRFFRDLRQTWLDALSEVDSHNNASTPSTVTSETETEGPDTVAWWDIR